jgi:tetratricopeptide (TPR) repeat protein
MSGVANKRPGREGVPRGRRLAAGIAAVLGVLVFAAGLGRYLWYGRSAPAPNPPAVVLAGRDPEVVAVVERATATVRESPRSAAAWGRLGMVLQAHDYLADARACFVEAQRLDPRDARWPYYLGMNLSSLGEPDAALPELRRAAELCGEDLAIARLRLAELLLQQGHTDEAAEQFRQVLRQDPGHPRAHLGLARVARARGDFPESLAHLAHSRSSPFARKGSAELLAEVHQRLGDRAAADRELHEAAGLTEDRAWPDPFRQEIERLKRGRQEYIARLKPLLARGREVEALALLQERVREDPDSEWAWQWLGQQLLQAKQFAAAERALREAARLRPDSAETLFNLGVALYRQDNTREAADCFRRAAALKPDHALAHFNLGQCLRKQGNRADAIEAFRAAVRWKPTFGDAHTKLGDLLLQDGHHAEALIHVQDALRLNPEDAQARKLLEQMLRRPAVPGRG